jgi:hypothetical protein
LRFIDPTYLYFQTPTKHTESNPLASFAVVLSLILKIFSRHFLTVVHASGVAAPLAPALVSPLLGTMIIVTVQLNANVCYDRFKRLHICVTGVETLQNGGHTT